jgi:hypothetical protein
MKNAEAEHPAIRWLFKWEVSTVSPCSHKYNSGLRLYGKVVEYSCPPGRDGDINISHPIVTRLSFCTFQGMRIYSRSSCLGG